MTQEEMAARFRELIYEFLATCDDDFDLVESACDDALNAVYTETQEVTTN